jgi:hypothetical protein
MLRLTGASGWVFYWNSAIMFQSSINVTYFVYAIKVRSIVECAFNFNENTLFIVLNVVRPALNFKITSSAREV